MDKVKKKQLKKYITWISMVAVVALLAVMPLLARQEAEEDGPVASVLEETVQTGSLETGIRGGGTLSADTAEAVELPDGVKITGFLVKNGDIVSEGDPVAEVDRVSVMSAIVRVRETMDYLQDQMDGAKSTSSTSAVKATAGGRVKQVFAASGDAVQDVMLRHGALAVLSLDGMMAVELEVNTDLAAGDPVTLTFFDGRAVSGRVESNLDGILVATVEDNGYEVGAAVEVTDGRGSSLGKGTLYVHNAWKAMAFDGTVSSVSARENTEVHSGAQLFTLKDADINGALESLASMHRDYEELLQKLFAMYESGVLAAPCDGKVSGVDEKSEYLLSAIDGETGWFVDLLSNQPEETGWHVVLLSNTDSPCTGDENCKAGKNDHEKDCPMRCTGKEGCTAVEHNTGCAVYCTGLSDCANQNHKTGCLGVCTGNDLCKSTREHRYHIGNCIKRCISDRDTDPATHCDANVHYPACIENCTEAEDCTALIHKENCPYYGITYTAKAAKVSLVTGDMGLLVIPGNTTYQVEPEGESWKLVSPASLQDVFVGEPQPLPVENPQEYQAGDILLIVTGTNSQGQVMYQDTVLYERSSQQEQPTPSLPGGGMNMEDILAGLMGGRGGFGGMPQNSGVELYPLETNTLMTVTEQNVMKLNITVDEHDIGKLKPGLIAQVKINAMKGRSFEAEITEIGAFGANNGGSSKFTVELTMPMEADMLPGMSATARIPLYTKMEVLTVPVAALVEQGGKSLIYTALDAETGEPAAPVEVETGISDGVRVEILSGLKSGDRIYYSYYDTVELTTDVEQSKYTFG
jgi:multidrug efflux pump subunit AcrA (membrane-fusion protein)